MCMKEVIRFHPFDVFTHVAPRFVPFIKTVVLYYVVWLPSDVPSMPAALLKCLPVLCLIGFVGSQGLSLEKQHDYRRRILIGLVFSVLGDALLIWEEQYFLVAMAFFGIAHISYIRAFGFSSFQWLKAIPFLSMLFVVCYLFYPGLSGVLLPCVFVYVWLICSMGWRAFATVELLDNATSWTSLCSVLGAVWFMLSDFLIGVDKFVTPLPYSRVCTITTYYIAQFFFAMSAVDKTNIRIRMQKKVQ